MLTVINMSDANLNSLGVRMNMSKKSLLIALLPLVFLISACGSGENKIVGKWQASREKNDVSATEICTFATNNTETCDEEVTIRNGVGNIVVKYVITQEWHIKEGVITEKYLDARMQEISINGDRIQPSDPRFQNVSSIILSDKPNGKTFSRKIEFKKDAFELVQEDGTRTEYKKIN